MKITHFNLKKTILRIAFFAFLVGILIAGLSFSNHSAQAEAKGAAAASPQTTVFQIDPVHTFILFKVGHLGFSQTYGRFTAVNGQFSIPDKGEISIDLTIDASSLITHDEKRDKHLKGPDFFDTKQYPQITFKSQSVKALKNNEYEINAIINMHGKSKLISTKFQQARRGTDPWGQTRTGGEARFTIKRSDFGINFMIGPDQIPDEVEVLVSIEGIQK